MFERDSTRSRIVTWSTCWRNRNSVSSISPNSRARLERGGRLAELVLRADDRAEASHPRHPLVALVPDQRQAAAGLEDPGDLGQRAVVVEPVERLGADDHVVRAVAGRDLLGRGLRRADLGQPLLQPGEHRGIGVGGVHVVAEGHQLLGELAGAGAELQDGEGLRVGQPGGGVARVGGSAAVVGVDHTTEGTGGVRGVLAHRDEITVVP